MNVLRIISLVVLAILGGVTIIFPYVTLIGLHILLLWKLPLVAIAIHLVLFTFVLKYEMKYIKNPFAFRSRYSSMPKNVYARIVWKSI